jgi:polysaccharide pyruvyl transferase WcaK-like protein
MKISTIIIYTIFISVNFVAMNFVLLNEKIEFKNDQLNKFYEIFNKELKTKDETARLVKILKTFDETLNTWEKSLNSNQIIEDNLQTIHKDFEFKQDIDKLLIDLRSILVKEEPSASIRLNNKNEDDIKLKTNFGDVKPSDLIKK